MPKKKTETKVTKPEVETKVKEPVQEAFLPMLGEKCEHDDNIIAITSFEPLTATVYARADGVVTTNDYPLDSLKGITPLTKQEIAERIF